MQWFSGMKWLRDFSFFFWKEMVKRFLLRGFFFVTSVEKKNVYVIQWTIFRITSIWTRAMHEKLIITLTNKCGSLSWNKIIVIVKYELILPKDNNNNRTLFHYVGLTTWIEVCHIVLSQTTFRSNLLIYKSFLIVSLIVLPVLRIPLVIWLFSIWFTLLTTESIGFHSTCSNHLNLFSTIFIL